MAPKRIEKLEIYGLSVDHHRRRERHSRCAGSPRSVWRLLSYSIAARKYFRCRLVTKCAISRHVGAVIAMASRQRLSAAAAPYGAQRKAQAASIGGMASRAAKQLVIGILIAA